MQWHLPRASASLILLSVLAACDPAPPNEEQGWRIGLSTDEAVGAFLSVWGSGRDDVWAVGGQPDTADGPGFGVLYHFDGESWSDVTPGSLDDPPLLNWIYGVDGHLWTVGERGMTYRADDPTGASWTAIPSPVDLPLWGVWGSAADDMWAVGGDATPGSGDPVLLHFDGDAWTARAIPPLDRNCDALFKVWGTSADHVFAVGDAGVILHFDGAEWAQVPSGTTSDLISLWGRGPDEIAAAGGRSNGTIVRWDGQAWTAEVLPGLPGLNGVWMDDEGRATVVGILGSVASVEPGSFEFEAQDGNASPMVLHATFGLEDGSRFAVGGTLDRSPPLSGIIIQSLP